MNTRSGGSVKILSTNLLWCCMIGNVLSPSLQIDVLRPEVCLTEYCGSRITSFAVSESQQCDCLLL